MRDHSVRDHSVRDHSVRDHSVRDQLAARHHPDGASGSTDQHQARQRNRRRMDLVVQGMQRALAVSDGEHTVVPDEIL